MLWLRWLAGEIQETPIIDQILNLLLKLKEWVTTLPSTFHEPAASPTVRNRMTVHCVLVVSNSQLISTAKQSQQAMLTEDCQGIGSQALQNNVAFLPYVTSIFLTVE